MTKLEVLTEGFGFIEGLRWHEGELWFSDFLERYVISIDGDGQVKRRGFFWGQPSGLGFTPDGEPLVVSMFDQCILRIEGGRTPKFAELRDVCKGPLNDMLVDPAGRAYVGCMGYDVFYEELILDAPRPAWVVLVSPDGQAVRATDDDLLQPNGMALTPDGAVLVVAETFGARLTAFDVAPNGTLSNRRSWANLGMRAPDGICMDSAGAIWAACAVRSETGVSGEFVRVAEGGEILDVIPAAPGRLAITCTLGGDDHGTLYCATVETDTERLLRGEAKAAIEFAVVDTPGFSTQ